MAKKHASDAWFVPVRGSYLPANGAGLAIYLVYAAYLATLGLTWFAYSRTAWSFVTQTVPLAVGAMLVTQHIASKHIK